MKINEHSKMLLSAIILVVTSTYIVLEVTAAFQTVYVKSGDYIIPEGQVDDNLYIRLQSPNSSIIMKSGSKLMNSKISCDASNHNEHAVIIEGSDAVLENVQFNVNNCGGDGIHAEGVSNIHIWQGTISKPKGFGINFNNVNNSEIFGVFINAAKSGGILLGSSNQNQIVTTLIFQVTNTVALKIDGNSHKNQVVRSRARHNNAVMQSDAEDNLFYHSVCEKRVGYVGCVTDYGDEPKNWGIPTDFQPVWRTACYPKSFQRGKCDYLTPQLAIAASSDNDRVVVDTNGQTGWGNVTISTQGLLLLGNELTMQGAYGYINYLDSLNVTAPNVHVQNFVVRSNPIVQNDTILTAITVK